MRMTARLAGIFLSLLMLAGCWSSVELNDRAFVRIVMVDKTDDGYELVLGMPLANRLIPGEVGGSSQSQGQPFTYFSKIDSNLSDAFRKIQNDLSRKITFGQTRVVIIGNRYAEEGIGSLLDLIAREPRVHINANLFVTHGPADQVIQLPLTMERFPSDIFYAYGRRKIATSINFKDILKAHYMGGDFLATRLVFGKTGIMNESNEQNWMGPDGAAVFKGDKMIGSLPGQKAAGALWIQGKPETREITVPSPTDGKVVSLLVERNSTRIRPLFMGDTLTFDIDVKTDLDIVASYSSINLKDHKQLKKMEKSVEDKIRQDVEHSIRLTRQMGTDAFQLNRYLEWKYPKQWNRLSKDWDEFFSKNVEIRCTTDATIRRIGVVKKTFTIEPRKDKEVSK
ncbi:Ger(x)C family spore germination protein [Paenibacillus sp. UNC499MF]|uniref:Ger(x)C family spore germination protein n=1 Tax=Paenibacillus sp. UNC499MF TaxID=1502751 RepID=UPI00089FBBDF|nr:Ger(x)C family spore germination protein [Paenibacillus sp. UNC499MF]SEF64906.1 spore germination protein KC [Paenibacillus sp. UNC499MF]